MRSHFALLVVLLSLLAAGTTVVAGDVHGHSMGDVHSHSISDTHAMQDRTSPNGTRKNGTTIRIKPRPDGDAEWNVSMQFPLHDENETAAFKQMGRDFENGELNDGDVAFSAETFRKIADREEVATGRRMEIRNSQYNSSVGNDTGTLALTFIWTNFTQVNNDEIHLNDVFVYNNGNSTWLRSLSAKQNLVIEDPDGHQIHNSNLGHEYGTIVLRGPISDIRSRSSGDELIDVTYVKKQISDKKGSSLPYKYAAAFLVLVGIIGAGVYAFLQRDDDDAPATDSEHVDERPPPPPDPQPEDDEPDLELLSDEERVEHLLKQNGGRMKQASIVKETNWSNAKVSQLLSAMNENDRVNKLRIGRENLITLPGEDITDFDSE